MVEVLKVSSRSNPNSVAGALAGVLRQTGAVEVQVVGAGALNQAIKAIAIARGFVAPSNIDLVCIPTFADIEIDGEGRTAIRLAVEDRARRQPTEDPSAPRAAHGERPAQGERPVPGERAGERVGERTGERVGGPPLERAAYAGATSGTNGYLG
jgi:stage V sporulation protein S